MPPWLRPTSSANAAAWFKRLRGGGAAGAGGYRAGVMDLEELRGIVDNPHNSALERAGAAVCLRRLAPKARMRIAEAADQVASPPLQALLRICAHEAEPDAEAQQALLEALWEAEVASASPKA